MYLICSNFVCGKTHFGQTQNEHKALVISMRPDKTRY